MHNIVLWVSLLILVYFRPSLFTSETYSDIIVNEIQNPKTRQGKYFNPYKVSYAVKAKTQMFLISG